MKPCSISHHYPTNCLLYKKFFFLFSKFWTFPKCKSDVSPTKHKIYKKNNNQKNSETDSLQFSFLYFKNTKFNHTKAIQFILFWFRCWWMFIYFLLRNFIWKDYFDFKIFFCWKSNFRTIRFTRKKWKPSLILIFVE